MSEFTTLIGFEDIWRPPVRPIRRTPETVLSPQARAQRVRAKLVRLINRTPEVMVKVTGRTRDGAHLRAHLDYISRNGELDLEDRDGATISGRSAIKELAEDWSAVAEADRRRRASTPFSHSVMLSMPAGIDPLAVRDAARAFAQEEFGDRFDYVFGLHTDAPHPHVHLSIRSLGDSGERLNPKKGDLETWRQVFAQALRDRGVEAEATPRRARGVTRKAERGPIRRIRERQEAGQGPMARIRRNAYSEAAKAAFGGDRELKVWERATVTRQKFIRRILARQAEQLMRHGDDRDRRLASEVDAFLAVMPAPDSQRLALARALREVNQSRSADDVDRNRNR